MSTQKLKDILTSLTAEEVYQLVDLAWSNVQERTHEFPVMEVVGIPTPEDDLGDEQWMYGWQAELKCPHCGRQDNFVYEEDRALRWFSQGVIEQEGADPDRLALDQHYDDYGDYEGQVFLCTSCSGPVSLPDNVEHD